MSTKEPEVNPEKIDSTVNGDAVTELSIEKSVTCPFCGVIHKLKLREEESGNAGANKEDGDSDIALMMRRMNAIMESICPACALVHYLRTVRFGQSCCHSPRLPRIHASRKGKKYITFTRKKR